MRSNLYWIVAFSVAALFSGCTTPAYTKDILKNKPSYEFQKKASYLSLARYWDDHAEKQMIDFKGASFLTIWDNEGRADITIGNGPYYGMIELTKIDDHTTLVKVFEWGYMANRIEEWKRLIENAPDN